MKPILFDKSATSFTTNGKGRLDLLSASVRIRPNVVNGFYMFVRRLGNCALQMPMS